MTTKQLISDPTEKSILTDLLIAKNNVLSLSALRAELKDDPDQYDYTEHDLDTFLFKYGLSSIEELPSPNIDDYNLSPL